MNMGTQNHSHTAGADERSLRIALVLTGSYLVAEVAGGLISGSLALLSDAAHMLTDVAALVIALTAIRLGARPADRKRTYGYYRFEILAAAVNASILILVAAYILWEAYRRFVSPPEVQSGLMLVVGSLGLVVNLISMQVLKHESERSLNVRGAYLEVWSDTLGSAGVVIASLVIHFTGWTPVDPLVAALIGFWVLPRTWVLLTQSVNILLEGVPQGLQLDEISTALEDIPGVLQVHDLHVWAITSGRNSLTAHLVVAAGPTPEQDILRQAHQTLEERFGISHSTVQIELEGCAPGENCWSESEHTHSHR